MFYLSFRYILYIVCHDIMSYINITHDRHIKDAMINETKPDNVLRIGNDTNPNTPITQIRDIQQPWVEKYRPSCVEDLVVDDHISEKLHKIIQTKNMPNIIMTGTPGCGKTSAVLCIAKQIIGSKWNEHCVELNASNNRGLDIIHNSIIHFCKKKKNGMHKILILDEADNITTKAQHSLSNLMDQYLDNTRFAFTCNDINKIIESIQSRCIIIKFQKPSVEKTINRLKEICTKESIHYTHAGMEALLTVSGNDLRQSINNMELVHHMGSITNDNVFNTCDVPYYTSIEKLLQAILAHKFYDAIDYIDDFINQGCSRSDICLFIIEHIKNGNLSDLIKIKFIDKVNKTYININNGHNTNLQLYACVGNMISMCTNDN